MEVRPFTIHVPDDVLDDLRRRLGHTRFPDEIPGAGWDYGSNLDYLLDCCVLGGKRQTVTLPYPSVAWQTTR